MMMMIVAEIKTRCQQSQDGMVFVRLELEHDCA